MRKVCTWAVVAGVLLAAAPSFAQKPKSQKEVDALMAIQNATTVDARLKAIDDLLTNFADTEFKNQVLDMAVETARQKNDPALVAVWADRALQANPKDYIAMVDMASVTAGQMKPFDLNLPDEAAKVTKYANGALDQIKDAAKPNPNMSDADWASYKADLTASAYEAIGMSYAVQKKYPEAIAAFKTGIAAKDSPVLMVRMGQSYAAAGQYDDAIATFEKAMANPQASPQVKQVAAANKAEAEKKKAAASGAPPAAGAAPAPKPQ